MKVTGADTAALNLDVDVVVAERLGLELVLVKFGPSLGAVDLEAGEFVWNGHDYGDVEAKPELTIKRQGRKVIRIDGAVLYFENELRGEK